MVRGELVRLPSPRDRRGREQRGARPGVIVQADDLLGLSTVVVAPTSTSAAGASFRPVIDVDGTATRVMTDQLRVFDTESLGTSLGRLDAAELRAVDEALSLVLGL
jgi:mRNA interferase MazF